MSELIPRARVWRNALLLPVVALVSLLWRPSAPGRHSRTAPRPEPTTPAPVPQTREAPAPAPQRSDRVRPYVPYPVPPDQERFRQVHTRHRARWRLTYAPTQTAPYQAHNRVVPSIVLAASDLDALDVALAEFSPPSYARPYLGSPNAPAKTQGGVI